MCATNCRHAHPALTEGQIRELVRDAVPVPNSPATDNIVRRLDRETDPHQTVQTSVRMGNYRLELEPSKARGDVLRWSVWVDVGEQEVDQASRVFHWCPRSDGLTTDEMVTLCRAIRQEG
jgi:hypothetical protein